MIASACITPLLLALLLAGDEQPAPPKPKPHVDQNELYRELLKAHGGVPALPTPSLKDGLNALEQHAVVVGLTNSRVKLDEFLRDAVVAPFILDIGKISNPKDGPRLRSIDLWFVAHGDLDAILKDGKAFDLFPRNGSQVAISAPELAKRGIAAPGPNVGFTHTSFDVIERVRLQVTLRTEWSRTADSVLSAATIDPRFTKDAQYPNTWSPILKGPNGVVRVGDPAPYTNLAFYLKATRLANPAGAFLVEYHTQFEQPAEWFDGKDLLTSKLPLAVQEGVRSFRRQIPRRK